MIAVTAVRPLDNYQLELSFSTGETRRFDVRPYLDKGIFNELKDAAYFRSVRVAFGSIAWPHEQDFGPESLYVESVRVSAATKEQPHISGRANTVDDLEK